MKMPIATVALLTLAMWVIIAVESSFGLPLASIALLWLLSRYLPKGWIIPWLVLLSLGIAVAYGISLSLSCLVVSIGWLTWVNSRALIPSETARLLVMGGTAAGILAVVAGAQPTTSLVIGTILSVLAIVTTSVTIWRRHLPYRYDK